MAALVLNLLHFSTLRKINFAKLAYVAAVEQEWWSRWIKTVLPTMLPAKKWKKEQPNLTVGDVVMLTYPGHFKDDYVLAKVTQVHPDSKSLVRRVTVQYRKKNLVCLL